MKKYISPAMQIAEIETQGMLMASVPTPTGPVIDGQDGNKAPAETDY